MMNKEQKKNYIAEMTANFENSEAVLVTHYQGLTVKQLDELRKEMREQGIQFKITKNKITKLALEIPLEILSLKGPEGITLLFPNPCSPLITMIEKSF